MEEVSVRLWTLKVVVVDVIGKYRGEIEESFKWY